MRLDQLIYVGYLLFVAAFVCLVVGMLTINFKLIISAMVVSGIGLIMLKWGE